MSQIDFDEWFTNQLVHEIKIRGNRFRIIRRRAIWLIGQWTGVKFDRQLRPQVYAACLHLVEPSEDMCVRITASKYGQIFLVGWLVLIELTKMSFFAQNINDNHGRL